jgi:hypothetical protein
MGRRNEKNGFLSMLADTKTHVCSIGSIYNLKDRFLVKDKNGNEKLEDKGPGALSAMLLMFIGMYMDGMTSRRSERERAWPLNTEENKDIITKLIKKRGKKGDGEDPMYK